MKLMVAVLALLGTGAHGARRALRESDLDYRLSDWHATYKTRAHDVFGKNDGAHSPLAHPRTLRCRLRSTVLH